LYALSVQEHHRIETAVDAANNISLPAPLLAEIRSAAQAEHCGVNEVLTDAVKRYIEERSWTKLLEYGAERARAGDVKESEVDRLIAESRVE
jgi:metal-responsive CopG/Arc/MetJ family transcriptional regulator